MTFSLYGRPDIIWKSNEPDLPAANVLGPGGVAESKGDYWVSTGPGAARKLEPGNVSGTIVSTKVTIEYYDTAGRHWTRRDYDAPKHAT
jgi:hypothetical protein